MTESIVATLKATALSHWMVHSLWLWPLCETLHFIGLTLVIGIAGLLDLRLLGFMRTMPIAAVQRLIPWAIAGFTINLITGVMFFIGAPGQYINNRVWWYKLLFLAVAGINVVFFETTQGARVLALEPGQDSPPTLKIIGALSLFSWFMVLYWGRMLPFIGDAF
jgi:hypothetical protein